MERRLVFAGTAVLIAVLGFMAGYVVAGGPQKLGTYTIGENISVKIRAPGQTSFQTLTLSRGMTVLDAVALVIPIRTEVYSFGAAVKTIDDRWLVYSVDGKPGEVGMGAYQLKGGETIELDFA
jgi:hypothetical protein